MEKIIILGKGGHARSIIDSIEKEGKYEIAGYVANEVEPNKEKYPVIGRDADLRTLFSMGIKKAVIGIEYLGYSKLRGILYNRLKEIEYELPVICDPTAILAADVEVQEGTFIGKGTIINAGAHIGKMCIINTGTIIEHDCVVGDFSHIAVGSVLCGTVKVEEDTFVGANTTIIQGKNVGKQCVIGAGTIVRKDVEDNSMIWDKKEYYFGGGYRLNTRKGDAA